jgi:acyl phosphate:glycerol-3-phosphate acyltransferase
MIGQTFIAMLGAYLIGSIPTGMVLSRLCSDIDVRSNGSGNIGATNVARLLGKKFGALTLAGDALKGYLPLWIVAAALRSSLAASELWITLCLTGLAVFTGHLFSAYLKFRGGKGVATACGVVLYLEPAVIPPALLIFTAVACVWRYVSLASLAATAAIPVLLLLFARSTAVPFPTILLSIFMGALIFMRHAPNIRRLLQGLEPKIGAAL